MLSKRKYNNKIIFRVDANATIGFGHLSRCMAAADMVRDDFDVSFAIQSPPDYILKRLQDLFSGLIILKTYSDPEKDFLAFSSHLNGNEIVVLDGMFFNSLYQKSIKEIGCKLLTIDDLHSGHFYADAVINRNPATKPEDYENEPYTNLYIGFRYCLVPLIFQKKIPEARIINDSDILFICFGGADPKNLTSKFLKIAADSKRFSKINVVTGSAYKHQKELVYFSSQLDLTVDLYSNINQDEMIRVMQMSEVAICPASSLVYEIFCIGLNLITGSFTEDQVAFAQYIQDDKLGISLGDLTDASIEDIHKAIVEAKSNHYYKRQKQVMEPDQSHLIKAIFEKLVAEDKHFILN